MIETAYDRRVLLFVHLFQTLSLGLVVGCGGASDNSNGRAIGVLNTLGSVELEDEKHPLFGVVGGVLLGEQVIVANGGAYELLYFDRAGDLRHAVGRRGGGPGEFHRIAWIQSSGGALFANDDLLGRVSEFDRQGSFVSSVNVVPPEGYISARALGVFPDRTLLVGAWKKVSAAQDVPITYRDSVALLRYGADGRYLDSVGTYAYSETYAERWGRGGQLYLELPLGRKAAVAVHGWHFYVLNDSASAVLMVDTAGSVLRTVPKDGVRAPAPLDDGEIARVRELVASRFPAHLGVRGIADRVPIERQAAPIGWAGKRPLSILRVDTLGNTWIMEFGGVRSSSPVWTVLLNDGTVRARLTAGAEMDILDADGEWALVRRWDAHDAEHVELRPVSW